MGTLNDFAVVLQFIAVCNESVLFFSKHIQYVCLINSVYVIYNPICKQAHKQMFHLFYKPHVFFLMNNLDT